ncbi:MAG: LysR family transcriptional regulator [Janthinobacterium lividum]
MLSDRLTAGVDWDKLRTFYFIAKIGSFTHTAQHLHISQSGLSRAIQSLEERLECQLFFRIPRGVVLTPKGQIVFEWVTQLFDSLEMMKERLQTESDELKGSLKVATTNALASAWIMYLLPEFIKSYPDLDLNIIGNDQELDLSLREADVLIRPYMVNRSDLSQTLVMKWHLKLYASPSYLEEYGTPKNVTDLKNHRLISFGEKIAFPYQNMDWFLRLGAARGEKHKSCLKINSSHGLLQAAEDGIGIISFSQESPLLARSKLVPVLPEIQGPVIEIFYIYPKEYQDVKKITVLLNYLKAKISQKDNA